MATVFFATSRARTDDPGGGDLFGDRAASDPAHRLWLGTAEVTTGGGPAEPREVRAFECTGRDNFEPADGTCGAVLDAFLGAASRPGAVPLLSIHGFQYTFEEALARTGELVEFYAAGPAPVRLVPLLFTWPSLGMFSADAYRRDRASATGAGRALGRLLVELAGRLEGAPSPRLSLLAHSMGVFALGHGVQAACAAPAWAANGPPRFLDTALLAAGDTDDRALGAGGPLAPLADMARQVVATVYNGDKVADWFGSGKGPNRSLAAKGPPLGAALPGNVFAFDCAFLIDTTLPVPQDQAEPNWIGHQYYRNQPAVRAHLARLLGGEQAPLPNWKRFWPPAPQNDAGGIRQAPFYWYGQDQAQDGAEAAA